MSRVITEHVLVNGFLIDCTVSESHEFESEVSDYPVESGIEISDNIRTKPLRVTLEGIVSNTPFGSVQAARAARAIDTSLDHYENMALVSVVFPRSAGEPEQLRFTAVFQQVTFITNDRSTVPVSSPRIGKKVGIGNQLPILVATEFARVVIPQLRFQALKGKLMNQHPASTPTNRTWWGGVADKPKPETSANEDINNAIQKYLNRPLE